jgi:hypothetical protein
VRYPVAKKAVDFHCSNVAVNDAGLSYFLSFGPLYYRSMLLHILLCAIAATTKSPRYHAFFAVFFLIYNLAMLGSNLLRLM